MLRVSDATFVHQRIPSDFQKSHVRDSKCAPEFPTNISDGNHFFLNNSVQFRPGDGTWEGNDCEYIIDEIEKIDPTWVLGWLTVELAQREQIEQLKSGIGYTGIVTDASLKDRMLNLNHFLSDLRVKLVVPLHLKIDIEISNLALPF